MGYILEGALFATCIGAYRVYTDKRQSVIHSNWDSWRHLFLALSRHSTDFGMKMCFDVLCHHPKQSQELLDKLISLLSIESGTISRVRKMIFLKTARYHMWSSYGNLGYLQRISLLSGDSLFDSRRSWTHNLTYTTPTLLTYVKDDSIKEYLALLSLVRDGMIGVLEAGPDDLGSFVRNTIANKRDIIQDVRKGHVLDRKAESSVPMVHALRMEIESFLFGNTGPDPDRSTYIEKAIKDESDGVVERLFPFLEVIVDVKGDSLHSSREMYQHLCPNIPIFVPFLKLGEEILGIAVGQNEFVIDPLHNGIRLKGVMNWGDLREGDSYQLSVEGKSDAIKVQYVGRQGQALRVKV
jgi:hypothetical protein